MAHPDSPECVEGEFCESAGGGIAKWGSRDPNVCEPSAALREEVTTLGNALTDQAVDEQQYDRSYRSYQDRPHIESRSSRAAKDPEQKASNHSAHHPNYGGHDNAAGIISGQHQLGQRTGD